MAVVSLPDGSTIPDFPDNPTPEDVARLQQLGSEMEAAMTRNPQPGGGPMPKLPFQDPRVETLPEALRVGAKTAYDATLGQGVGLNRLAKMGLEKGVGLFSPGTENSMREAREFDDRTNPFTKAGRAAEEFIQPRSSEGTRVANVGSAVLGGGLAGKLSPAFSPAMGAATGGAGATAGELYGIASNPQKLSGDPANDEQLGKFGFGLGVGALAPGTTSFFQAGLTSKYDKRHLADLAKAAGLDPRELEAVMGDKGILRKAEAVGIPLTTAQAIPRENPLDAVQGLAKDRLELALTRQRLGAQPQESIDAVERVAHGPLVGQGQRLNPQTLANQGRAGANAYFDMLGDEATGAKLAGIAANGGPPVPQDVAGEFVARAREYAKTKPGTRADRVVRAVEKAITNKEWLEAEKELAAAAKTQGGKGDKLLGNAGLAPAPVNPHPQFIGDEAQLRGALDSALGGFGQNLADTKAVTAELNSHAGYLRGLIGEVIAPKTPGVNAGKKAAESVLLEADRAKKQLTGALHSDNTDVPAPLTSSPASLFRDLNRGPVQGQRGELSELRRNLEQGTAFGLDKAQQTGKAPVDLNPRLFPDATRTWFEDVLERAGTGGGARPNTEAAQILLEELGNRGKRANMTGEIMQNTGDSLGMPSPAIGLEKEKLRDAMDIIGHTVERRGAGGLSERQVLEKAAPKELKTVSGFSLVAPLRFPFRWAYGKHESASLKWLDKVLNTDEGRREFVRQMNLPVEQVRKAALVNSLQELSKQPRRADEAKAAQQRKGK